MNIETYNITANFILDDIKYIKTIGIDPEIEIYIIDLFFYFIHILPTPPHGQDMTQGQFFKRSLTGFNSEFSFS